MGESFELKKGGLILNRTYIRKLTEREVLNHADKKLIVL